MENTRSANSTASEIFPPSATLAREVEEPPPSGPLDRAVDGAVFPLLDNYEQVESSRCTGVPEVSEETLKARQKRKKQSLRLSFRMSAFNKGRAERIARCSDALTRRTCMSCGRARFHAERCGDRLCPICARIRSAKLVSKYGPALAAYGAGKHAYFLTLTYANVDHLPDRKRLAADFRALKGKAFWRRYGGIVGGAYNVEVTLNKKTGRFHPHMHALIYTLEPIPCFTDNKGVERWQVKEVNQVVSDMWREITGGSYIIDGRAFDGRYEELMKYVTAMDEVDIMPDDQLKELCGWLKGMRAFTTFGGLYKLKLSEPGEEPERDAACECGCTFHEELTLQYDRRLASYVPVSCAIVDCSSGEQVKDASSPP